MANPSPSAETMRADELTNARETIRRLNRRVQAAESGLAQHVDEAKRAGPSLGRGLANSAATMYHARLEEIAQLVGYDGQGRLDGYAGLIEWLRARSSGAEDTSERFGEDETRWEVVNEDGVRYGNEFKRDRFECRDEAERVLRYWRSCNLSYRGKPIVWHLVRAVTTRTIELASDRMTGGQ